MRFGALCWMSAGTLLSLAPIVSARLLFVQQAPEHRAWLGRVELRGPLSELRLDAGAQGHTHVQLDLAAGERRELALPVPVRAPLNGAVQAVPSPEVSSTGAGDVRWLGWHEQQPARALARALPDCMRRPRPALAVEHPVPSLAQLLGLVLIGVLVLVLRRSPRRALALALVAGAGLYATGARREPRAVRPLRHLDVDGESGLGLSIHVARDVLEGRFERLEVRPAGARLELELDLRTSAGAGRGWARAPGATLHGLRRTAVVLDGQGPPGGVPLEQAWYRAADGTWTILGPWPAGVAAPTGAGADGPGPPGWLAAGLPLGQGALLGRSSGAEWLRMCPAAEPPMAQSGGPGTESGPGD